jgi:hypothetical protein
MSAAEQAVLSPLDRAVLVTTFASASAREKREEFVSFRQLALKVRNTIGPEKARLPWLKLAAFGDVRSDQGSLRNNKNVLAISGIEADYDGEKVSLDEAVAMLRSAGVAGMLYTSPSHSEDAPRWRILCPVSADRAPDRREPLLARLNGVLGGVLAPESFTLSQSYYFGSVNSNPSHRVELIDGAYLDERNDLDTGAIGRPVKERPAQRPISSGGYEPISDRRWNAYLATILDSLRRQAVDGQKHQQLWNHAVWLGGCYEQMGLSSKTALDLLENCLPNTVEDWDAARRTAGEGLLAGRARPITLENREFRAGGQKAVNDHVGGQRVNGQAAPQPVQPDSDDGAGDGGDAPQGTPAGGGGQSLRMVELPPARRWR